MTAEECAENGYVFFRGKCYTHALETLPGPQPTSNPAEDP
jgi:hypothetical protein